MNLADQLATLVTEDAELSVDVTALGGLISSQGTKLTDMQAQIDALTASGVSPAQTAALQGVLDNMKATHEQALTFLPAAVVTAPAAADTGNAAGPAEPRNAQLPDQPPA